MLVNDDLTQLDVLSGLLREEELEVMVFQSAEAALAAMDWHRLPDLIIVELLMPVIDGWRFCRLLRSPEYRYCNRIPILFLSATLASEETAVILDELGPHAFMISPVDHSRFIEHVRAIREGRLPQHSQRVLIVENSRNVADGLQKAFSTNGYLADTALTARSAAEAFANGTYDVAVLDAHLPDGKGDGLLADFLAGRPDCICIMMSTDPSPDLALAWMRQGAAAYLRKPFAPESLIKLCTATRQERNLLQREEQLRKGSQSLREAECRYRAFFEQNPDGVVILDPETARPLEFNDQASMQLGYSRQEFARLHLWDIEAKETAAESRARIRKIMDEGNDDFDTMHRTKQGEIRHAHVTAQMINVAGRPVYHCIWRDITERKRIENRLERLAECLLGLEDDYAVNMSRLAALCGEELGATCALYNRLEGGLLCTLGQWHTPPDYELRDKPEGHICFDVIRGGGKDALLVRNLPDTPYARTDPNVSRYGLKTYLGHVVHCFGEAVGSLCAVFQHDFEPSNDDMRLMDIIAAAIGREEERRRVTEMLRESEARVRAKLDAILLPEGDVGLLDLRDLLDLHVVQELIDDIFRLTNIGVGIGDLQGKVLVASGWRDICLKFHRVHPESRRNCLESDTQLSAGVPAGTFKMYKCKNNMWDIVTPIMVGGRHLANLFFGQFFLSDETPDRDIFLAQAQKYGFDEDDYLAALDRVPRWSRETVDTVMHFYARLTSLLSTLSYSNIKLARVLEERRKAEGALRQSETLLAQSNQIMTGVLDHTHMMAAYLDVEFNFIWVNRAYAETCRQDLDFFPGQNHFDLYPHEENQAIFQQVVDSGKPFFVAAKPFEFLDQPERGVTYWDWSLIPTRDASGKTLGLVFTLAEITSRVRAEEQLREHARELQWLFKSMINAFVLFESVFDADGNFISYRFVYINDAYERITGVKNEEVKGRTVHEVWPETESEWIKKYGGVAVSGVTQTFDLYHDPTGKLYHCNVYRPWDTPDRFCVIFEDITERKRTETERERLLMAIEQSGEMIVITDPEGSIQYVNPAFTRTTGYSHDEAIGHNPRILKSGKQDVAFYAEMWRVISGGQNWQGRFVNKRKDGTFYIEEATISPVLDAEGRIVNYVAVKRDITEQIRIQEENAKLEMQFQQAQKMESVGRLAGGVAHDFNNMMGVILGYTELALIQMDPVQPLYADLQEIKKAAQRSANLTRQLLAFARKQTVAPKVLDLNETVEGMLKMIIRLIGEDIDLAWLPTAGLWPVKMDPAQVDQILANLCINARDAIAGVGKLTIETQNTAFDEDYCAEHAGFIPGDFVLFTVSDDGCGMDKETLDKLFEPFFTTKAAGHGTGLGLATVYGVVKQNNGFINVYSEPGQGSVFKIYLPRHASKTGQMREESPAAPNKQGNETILLVEDEESILKITRRMLKKLGYRVLTASTPGEAFTVAKEHAGEIKLLLTDVVMPDMNGPKLAKELISLYPGLRSLFMSGYTGNVIAQHDILDDSINFIQKPFSHQALAAKVRETLECK